eukprot:gene4676-585_t
MFEKETTWNIEAAAPAPYGAKGGGEGSTAPLFCGRAPA